MDRNRTPAGHALVEEIAHAATHGVGFALSLVGSAALMLAAREGDAVERVHPTEPAEVILSLREAATPMLEPPITNIGIQGIRKAAGRVVKWPESMGIEELQRACFNCFIFIDATGGTGGGLFRYMYGRYLKEAAAITGRKELVAVGEEFRQIGDRWQEVSGIFKLAAECQNPAAQLAKIKELLLAIADLEQAAWNRLRDVARSSGS